MGTSVTKVTKSGSSAARAGTRGGRAGDAAETRRALLEAAHHRFARQGYDATTLRQVAGDAGVDPALVIRYFGSKERMFAEVTRPAPVLEPIIRETPLDRLGEALLRQMLSCAGETEDPMLALLRSSGYERFAAIFRDAFESDLRGILEERLAGPDASLRAELVGAQVVGLKLIRAMLGEGCAAMDAEAVIACYAPALQAIITPTQAAGSGAT
jgi:AcrR family transcriptional regulator